MNAARCIRPATCNPNPPRHGHGDRSERMSGITYTQLMVATVVPATVLACWIDYSARKVPNWLNAALAAAGIIAQTAYFGTSGLWASLLGMAVGLGVLIVPWAMHGMGAGDVKLMAAIGAWFGPWMC